MKCAQCGNDDGSLRVKDDSGVIINVCEECFDSCCEGYEKV